MQKHTQFELHCLHWRSSEWHYRVPNSPQPFWKSSSFWAYYLECPQWHRCWTRRALGEQVGRHRRASHWWCCWTSRAPPPRAVREGANPRCPSSRLRLGRLRPSRGWRRRRRRRWLGKDSEAFGESLPWAGLWQYWECLGGFGLNNKKKNKQSKADVEGLFFCLKLFGAFLIRNIFSLFFNGECPWQNWEAGWPSTIWNRNHRMSCIFRF